MYIYGYSFKTFRVLKEPRPYTISYFLRKNTHNASGWHEKQDQLYRTIERCAILFLDRIKPV